MSRSPPSSTPPAPTRSPPQSSSPPDASIAPVLYLRRGGNVTEHQLAPHPLHVYETDENRAELEHALSALVRAAA